MSAGYHRLTLEADETALELFRRVRARPFTTGLDFIDHAYTAGVTLGAVVELYGDSGSGKTEILLNIAVKCILSKTLGGEEKTVVYFDNDYRLSLLRLELLLRGRIENSTAFLAEAFTPPDQYAGSALPGSQGKEHIVQAHITDCLARLKVVRPTSTFELLAALEVLYVEVGDRPTVLALDSLGTFLWEDRLAESCGGSAVVMQSGMLRTLTRILKERPVMLFASKPAMFGQKTSGPLEHREYLPQAWQRLVTQRVILQPRQQHRHFATWQSAGAQPMAQPTCTVIDARLAIGELQHRSLKFTFVVGESGITSMPPMEE